MAISHWPMTEREYDGTATITGAVDVQADFIAELLKTREKAIATNDTQALRVAERVLQDITLYKTYLSLRLIN